jgi:hypothetical protein
MIEDMFFVLNVYLAATSSTGERDKAWEKKTSSKSIWSETVETHLIDILLQGHSVYKWDRSVLHVEEAMLNVSSTNRADPITLGQWTLQQPSNHGCHLLKGNIDSVLALLVGALLVDPGAERWSGDVLHHQICIAIGFEDFVYRRHKRSWAIG